MSGLEGHDWEGVSRLQGTTMNDVWKLRQDTIQISGIFLSALFSFLPRTVSPIYQQPIVLSHLKYSVTELKASEIVDLNLLSLWKKLKLREDTGLSSIS